MNVIELQEVQLCNIFLTAARKEGWEARDFAELVTDKTKIREVLYYLRGERYIVMPKRADRFLWQSVLFGMRD
jgi:hypothetical protein